MTTASITPAGRVFVGSVERAGDGTAVVMSCTSPGAFRLRRRSLLGGIGIALRGAISPDDALGDLGRFASLSAISADTAEAIDAILRSPEFRITAQKLLEHASAVEFDGSTARALVRNPDDEDALGEVAELLSAVCGAVEAVIIAPANDRGRPHDDDVGVAPSRGPLRFLGPLSELVAIGLYRPALDALCRGAEAVIRPPIDRAYLLKILEEEVGRQFGHPLRPLVELVLNAVDALNSDPRVVDVILEDDRVTVADLGEGMTLRTILSKLLVPFSTDKTPGVDLGRFGVGFFSVLGLAIQDPASFSLHVETGDGEEGWSIRVVAGGVGAGALIASVRSIAPVRGTRVAVTSAVLDAESVRSYLRDALHFFPKERATIRVGGEAINDGSVMTGGRLYHDFAGPDLVGRFYLGGRALMPGLTAATYHAGVKIEPCFAVSDLALLDFPGAVEITESRDALKPGPALGAVAAAFHRRLVKIADEAGVDTAGRDRIAEFAAQVSALMLQSAGWETVAKELAAALLGTDRYLISPDRAEVVLGFLGPGAAPRVFVPESFWAEREWHGHLPGERELLEDELTLDPPESLAALARRRRDLLGLDFLVARAASPETLMVALAHGKRRSAGPMPCLGTRRALLVRGDSPAVRSPRGWTDLYALRLAFDRAAGLREADAERDLIVAAPISSVDPDRITSVGWAQAGTRGR